MTLQNGYCLPPEWYGKPYYSLDAWCKNTYGEKLYKIALDIGCSCPNRDGKIGYGGCIFCSEGGSGEFAAPADPANRTDSAAAQTAPVLTPGPCGQTQDAAVPAGSSPAAPADSAIAAQLAAGRALFGAKKTGSRYIAYFQSYTNTYGDPTRLGSLYEEALKAPDVAGISIATRPDCLFPEILCRIDDLRNRYPDKFIWIELGLQSIHEKTALLIRRGYPFSVFEEAMETLRRHQLPAIVHVILGLPGESRQEMLETVRAMNDFSPFGIKLQLLHVLKNTDLADLYRNHFFETLSKEAYLELVTDAIAALSTDICIHRITGDGPKSLLIAPDWSRNKRDVLNSIHARMKQKDIRQGSNHESGTPDTL